MEPSRSPKGGFWEAAQPLVPAWGRTLRREGLVSVKGGGSVPVTSVRKRRRRKLTVGGRPHAAQAAALHQRAAQRLVAGALAQTAPTGLTNQSRVGAEPQILSNHGVFGTSRETMTSSSAKFIEWKLKAEDPTPHPHRHTTSRVLGSARTSGQNHMSLCGLRWTSKRLTEKRH